MEKVLRTIEKFIPKKLFKAAQPVYHYLLALVGATIYGFPAKKLFIIGVTGTKGKSSTAEIINAILEEAGYKTALCNTIRFKIDKESIPNKFKMSMPGRFFVHNFLHRAVKSGCTHAVVEITSEGSKQFRHKFIWLNAFVFTNLAPEHIESHGSYEKYKEAKLRIADLVTKKNGIVVVNGDDEESEAFFNRTNVEKKIKYSLSDAKPIVYGHETEMRFKRNTLYSKLPGEFNVYNILAAATVTDAIGIDVETIKKAVENLVEIPGRAQKVNLGQNFDVVVDYAHTAESLEELYKAFPERNKICVLGNTGGGRDKWKRPIMAKIAEKYCSEIILTNEDPYDENPEQIVKEMKNALTEKTAKVIMDRREAIHTAIKHAKNGDAVLITGKGTDPYLMEANNKKTPWSDYEVAKEELEKILNK
jgi:UDP-N-acetylmuramoyl-L-alanyl-D-glutamate--2,6-diaminopimelate ligase